MGSYEVGENYHVSLTAAGGISPTVARIADKVILELNAFHSDKTALIHDVYEPLDAPFRMPIPITKPSDRIGTPYLEIPKSKVVAKEIENVKSLGVKIETNVVVGKSITVDELIEDEESYEKMKSSEEN